MTSDLLEWSHEVAPRGGNLRGLDDTLLGGVAVAKRTPLIVPCGHCGQQFDARAKSGKVRSYCSNYCREAAYRARRDAARPTFGTCEAPGCDTPRRSRNARWCEMHYMRWYRNNPVEDGRLRGGICHHCGEPTPSKRRYYCSTLCKTRSRVDVAYRPERSCVVCDQLIPHTARYNRASCCSGQCTDTARLIQSYGITVEQYRSMEQSQGGKCAVCQKVDKLRIDHHHGDGVVRGLLCNRCNLGLGLFLDDPVSLRRAATYLDGRLF